VGINAARALDTVAETQSLRLIFTISPLKASTFISILWPPASRPWTEGHVAYVIDAEVLGAGSGGQGGRGKGE